MFPTRLRVHIVFALILGLVMTGCGRVAWEADWQTSPLPQASLASAATLTPTLVPTSVPTATPAATQVPGRLVVLHTNDNWGETEPCG
jgi:hypothetical protein